MKIAILGGRGVVGGFLSTALSANHTVTSITRDMFDLRDYKSMKTYFDNNTFDVIINSAINVDSQMSASMEVAADNLSIFNNMYACRKSFGRVIQLCSGAEFDRRQSIDSASEDLLFESRPLDPYGLSKNTAAKISFSTENFYNVRLFGLFFPTEAPRRLLPKILSEQSITIEDKYFDYLYLEDLFPVIEHYITETEPKYKDMNVVYPEKLLLSEFVYQFCEIHGIDKNKIQCGSPTGVNYTGDSSRFDSLDLPRQGIINGMKRYK